MIDVIEHLEVCGYASLPRVFTQTQTEWMTAELQQCCAQPQPAVRAAASEVYAARDLLRLCPAVITWWCQPVLVDLIRHVLGPQAGLVRGLLFDKPPASSWAVPWHKDRSIVIRAPQVRSAAYSPPRLKADLWHCEPPESVLQRMLALRIHLDPSTVENGPLSVVSGSHRHGPQGEVVQLLADTGDVLAMRPLIDHASPHSAPHCTSHRRVIHLEFSADPQLPDDYEWNEFHPLPCV
jgi:hypothetical protein